MYVYYRGWQKKLHAIECNGFDTPNDAIKAVRAELIEQKEMFHEPILVVFKGGKYGI